MPATGGTRRVPMKEIMYDLSSWRIVATLFVTMALAIELGHRIGRRAQPNASDATKAHINAIQASLLGVLALLLGFTFSLSLQRYDTRSSAVVVEANAIGTTYLRAQLLVPEIRVDVLPLLRDYLDVRIRASAVSVIREEDRKELLTEAKRIQSELWTLAREATNVDDRPVTTGLFIQSLNDLIDALEIRDAAVNRHVPEVVLFLLYGTFVMTGCIVGYASGVACHRASFVTYVMVGLIALLVFVIIDLDRPRRGLIEVRQTSLTELREAFAAE
jgi:hypothetical protein